MENGVTAKTPEPSSLTSFIESSNLSSKVDSHFLNVALQVQYDLQYQHEWTSLTVYTHLPRHNHSETHPLPRPLVSGIAPRHLYIHPDDQVEMLKQGINEKHVPVQAEWVLPTHVREKWSLRKFAAVFDAIGEASPGGEKEEEKASWQNSTRQKRMLMAVVNDDSTIVYYIIHDGLVKPRQN